MYKSVYCFGSYFFRGTIFWTIYSN